MNDNPIADLAVYLRVSSDEQKRAGTIETQRGVLDKYITLHALTAYGWYEDEAWSGYTVAFAARPEGARLMADITAGYVKTVLVRKLDRFGRNARDILNAVHALEEAGARLISLKENVDTSTAAGRFFLTVLAGVAELEREMIVERSAEGMDRRLERTAWMGGRAPIGYRVEGKKESAQLVLDDQPSDCGYSGTDVVRLAWHLLVEQDWPCDRIALRLDALGIPTRQGGEGSRWEPGVVYRMLTDPIYTGLRTYHTQSGQTITHPVPEILTAEQFDRAQAVLAAHRRVSHRAGAQNYLLRGMLRCGLCGALYTTSWARLNGGKGKLWRYYACSTRHHHRTHEKRAGVEGGPASLPNCVAPSVDAADLEAQVWADIAGYIRNPGQALVKLAAIDSANASDADAHRAALAHVQQALDMQQQQRDTVVALYRRGRISERDLERQLDDIAREEASHQREHARFTAAMQAATDGEQRLRTARTLLQQLHARLDSADTLTPAVQREVAQALVREIRVDTLEVGLSTRGRMKREARVHVFYAFDAPQGEHSCDSPRR